MCSLCTLSGNPNSHYYYLDPLADDLHDISLLTHNTNLFVSHSFKNANIFIHDCHEQRLVSTSKIQLFVGALDVENRLASRDPPCPLQHPWLPNAFLHDTHCLVLPPVQFWNQAQDLPPWLNPSYFWNILGRPQYLRGKCGAAKYQTRPEMGDQKSKDARKP